MRVHRRTAGPPYWVDQDKQRHDWLTLVNVRTVIDPERLANSRADGKRYQCAWIEGEPVDRHPEATWDRVAFDPLTDDDFQAGGEPWNRAAAVLLCAEGVAYVMGARLSDG